MGRRWQPFIPLKVDYFETGTNTRLPSVPMLPLHQSQEAFPARIQEVSLIAESGFRLMMTLDSISLPGSVPTSSTLQAEWCGKEPVTAMSGSSR